MKKVSRNDNCPCGSGLKYKRCCEDGGLPKDQIGGLLSEIPKSLQHMSPYQFTEFKAPTHEPGKDVDVGFHFFVSDKAREGVAMFIAAGRRITANDPLYLYKITPKYRHKRLLGVKDQGLKEHLQHGNHGETWDTCNIINKVNMALGLALSRDYTKVVAVTPGGERYLRENPSHRNIIMEGINYILAWNKRIKAGETKLSTEDQLKWLAQWFDRLSFDGVWYENIHEKGGVSIVLFDQNKIQIDGVQETTFFEMTGANLVSR